MSLGRMNRHVSAEQLQRGQENQAVMREQHEQDQLQAMWRSQEMGKRDKSAMDFMRADTSQAQAVLDDYAELSAAMDEAVDEIEKAFARERHTSNARGPDADDLRRAPSLGNRGGVS